MDCTQCGGLVERSRPPRLPWDTQAALGRRTWRMLEAASGQLYPASTQATRFELTGPQTGTASPLSAFQLCAPPSELENIDSLTLCERTCRPSGE